MTATSRRAESARLAYNASRATDRLMNALSWAKGCRSRGSNAGTAEVVAAYGRAFTAASAACHLPSFNRCMLVVQEAEGWMLANGVYFTR